jgi:hypothetical protein
MWCSSLKKRARTEVTESSEGAPEAESGIDTAKDEEVIDGLKRWLDRKDVTFLEWLEEDSGFKMDFHTPEESEVIRSNLANFEMERSEFEMLLLTEGELAQRHSAVSPSSIDLGQRLKKLIEDNKDLSKEVHRLTSLIEDLKVSFKASMEGLSDDKSSLIMKEMDLKEMESRLNSSMNDMESRGSDANITAVKGLEKGFTDRYRSGRRRSAGSVERWSSRAISIIWKRT